MVAKKPVTYRIITLDDDTEVRKLFKECPGHDKNPHEVMQDDFVKKIKGAHGLSTYCKACNSVIFKRQDYKKTKRDKPGYDNPRKRKHEVINGVQHVFCGKCERMLPNDIFSQNHGTKPNGTPISWDGLSRWCKECHNKYKYHCQQKLTCQWNGCTFTCAFQCQLKIHNNIHTGETPFHCDICDCKFLYPQAMYWHVKSVHNDAYIARHKQQEARVCDALIASGWKEWFHPEIMPPTYHFKREKKIDFSCVDSNDTWCRIDFVLGYDSGYVFLEVDENQHKFGYYNDTLACDMKRMGKVMTSLTLETDKVPNIMWLRYNPNAYRIDGELQSISKKDREAWLTEYLIKLVLDTPLSIGYAFYDMVEDDLEVLYNEEYHDEFKSIAYSLTFHYDGKTIPL